MSFFKKIAKADEAANGAETVEIVIGIVFAVGMGSALLYFQGYLSNMVNEAGNGVANLFNNLASKSGNNVNQV